MISILLFVVAYVLQISLPFYVFLASGLIDGLALLPILSITLIPALGRFVRDTVGGLYHFLWSRSVDELAIVQTGHGYEWARPDGDELHLNDGQTVPFDREETTWYRWKRRKIALVPLPAESVFGDRLVGDGGVDVRCTTKGGEGILKRKRGGVHGWTPWPNGDADGLMLSLSREINRLRGAADDSLSERAEKVGKKESGGNQSLSNKQRLLGSLGAMVLGVVVGLAIFII